MKKFLCLMLSLIMLLSLVSCGKKTTLPSDDHTHAVESQEEAEVNENVIFNLNETIEMGDTFGSTISYFNGRRYEAEYSTRLFIDTDAVKPIVLNCVESETESTAEEAFNHMNNGESFAALNDYVNASFDASAVSEFTITTEEGSGTTVFGDMSNPSEVYRICGTVADKDNNSYPVYGFAFYLNGCEYLLVGAVLSESRGEEELNSLMAEVDGMMASVQDGTATFHFSEDEGELELADDVVAVDFEGVDPDSIEIEWDT